MTRLGYQIPNFDYPGLERSDAFRVTVESAKAAEASGFDTVLVMDHFYQLPMLGRPEEPMFEAYSLLTALAARTSTVRPYCGTVTENGCSANRPLSPKTSKRKRLIERPLSRQVLRAASRSP